MQSDPRWHEQWRRMQRYIQLLRASRDEYRNDRHGTEGYRDELYATFQALWHLKDWLKNDTDQQVADIGKRAEKWLETTDAKHLQIAADVAHGSKHLRVDDKRADGSSQTRNDAEVRIGRGVRHTFWIEDARDGTEYEAVDLAERCIEEWRTFLSDNKLSLPS